MPFLLVATPVFATSIPTLDHAACAASHTVVRQAYEHNQYAVPPGVSRIMLAAIDGKTTVVRAGLAVMPPSERRYWRLEAMDEAACFDQPAVVAALLSDGADANAPVPKVSFKTTDHSAVGASRSSEAIHHRAALAPPAIFGAIDCHKLAMVKLLLRHGANPNYQYKGVNPIYRQGGSPYTPLLSAVVDQDASIVQALLDAGADPCVVDRGFANARRQLHKPARPNELARTARLEGFPSALVQRLMCQAPATAS